MIDGERESSAAFHASLIIGALSMHGCDFERPVFGGTRVGILGTTRSGLPLEVTVEVHA